MSMVFGVVFDAYYRLPGGLDLELHTSALVHHIFFTVAPFGSSGIRPAKSSFWKGCNINLMELAGLYRVPPTSVIRLSNTWAIDIVASTHSLEACGHAPSSKCSVVKARSTHFLLSSCHGEPFQAELFQEATGEAHSVEQTR